MNHFHVSLIIYIKRSNKKKSFHYMHLSAENDMYNNYQKYLKFSVLLASVLHSQFNRIEVIHKRYKIQEYYMSYYIHIRIAFIRIRIKSSIT